jgi:ribosome-associated heat shock protein Hsp15
MPELDKIRIDKWLWAIRFFKTRSLASDACHAGRVKINGDSVKASRLLRIGEVVQVQREQEKKILRVLQLIEKRVAAPQAVLCYEDLSPVIPKSEWHDSVFRMPSVLRDRGTGRPTKKERREIDTYLDDEDDADSDN